MIDGQHDATVPKGYTAGGIALGEESFAEIHDNEIHGFANGLYFYDDASAKIYNNIITEHVRYGIVTNNGAVPDLGGGATGSPGNNQIFSNGLNNIYHGSAETVFAQNNFWNTNDLLAIDNSIYDDDEDPSLGPVLFTPTIFFLIERETLIALYTNTNGDGWNSNTNWLGPPGTEESWEGVLVSGGYLTQLDLAGNKLVGSLPSQLGDLTALQILRLNSNQLTGVIPTDLATLTNLQSVDLSYNALHTDNADLRLFLNQKHPGVDWEGAQTVAPTNLAVGEITSTSVEFSWTPIAYTSDDGYYEVVYGTTQGGPYSGSIKTLNKSASSIVIDGLSPSTIYYFRVLTVTLPHLNNANTVSSEFSAEQSVLVKTECVIPGIPLLSGPSSATSGQLYTFSWTSTSPDITSEIQEATNSSFTGGQTFTVTGTSRIFSHTVVDPATYYYRVRAVDQCNGADLKSAWSTALSTVVNPNTAPGTVKWSFATGSLVYSSPAIASEDTIYVGSLDGNLYALDRNGTQKWSFATGSMVYSSPAIGADGTAYVGSYDGNLYAINADGTKKWAFPAGGAAASVPSSPAIGADGTVYVGSSDGNLYAVQADGTQKWEFATGSAVFSSPAIGADGTLYVGSNDGNMYAIQADSAQKWTFATGAAVASSPAIGADGTLYVGSNDGNLYAINEDGTQKWAFTTGAAVASSPAIGPDGTLYVGSNDDNLYAINANGTQKWAFTTGADVAPSPAIGTDGTVYVTSNDGNLYAVNANGTQKWAFTTGPSADSSPAIGTDGTVYVGSNGGSLYAINGSSGGLSNSPWPMFHHDLEHAGQVEQGPRTVLVANFMNGNDDVFNSRVYLWNPSTSAGTVTVRVFTLPLRGGTARELTDTPLDLGTLGARSALNVKLAEDILTPVGITPPYTTNGGNLTLEFTIQAAGVRGTAQVFSSSFALGTYPLQVIQ